MRLHVPPLPRPTLSAPIPAPYVGGPLALCGLLMLLLVGRETGVSGLAAGIALAALPVPFLVGVFWWLDGVTPSAWRHLGFAFAWGACAATLVALVANGLLVHLLTGDDARMAPVGLGPIDTLELTLVAPVVEESAKAVAVLLLFLHRPHAFDGVLAGIGAAGVTATGFAFTENVLYLGSAVTQDREGGGMFGSTLATFFVRILLAPFAHPLFTVLTGVGLGLAAALAPHRRHRRALRVALPLVGLAAAVGLHSAWNAATSLSFTGFAAVYGLGMMPVFVLLAWLALWSRQRELRAARETLPRYAAAGWLDPVELPALTTSRGRSLARRLGRQAHGWRGVRAVADYQATAGTLAVLRHRAERQRAAGADFVAREAALLARLTRLRQVAGGPTARAATELRRLLPDLEEVEPLAAAAVVSATDGAHGGDHGDHEYGRRGDHGPRGGGPATDPITVPYPSGHPSGQLPTLPELSKLSEVPELPDLPDLPDLADERA